MWSPSQGSYLFQYRSCLSGDGKALEVELEQGGRGLEQALGTFFGGEEHSGQTAMPLLCAWDWPGLAMRFPDE